MSADKNGSNSRDRRHFSPQQKVAIVKEHLVDGVPISDLGDREAYYNRRSESRIVGALAAHATCAKSLAGKLRADVGRAQLVYCGKRWRTAARIAGWR